MFLQAAGSSLNIVTGRGIAPVPARAIWDLIRVFERKGEWDKLFKSGRVLAKLDQFTGLNNPMYLINAIALSKFVCGTTCNIFRWRHCC